MAAPDACLDRHVRCTDGPITGLKGCPGVEGAGEGEKGAAGPQSITFRVEGMAPAPQGSKDWLPNGAMRESCANVKPWRELVTLEAIAAKVPLLRGPVRMSAVFLFERPAGHYSKNGSLKPTNPVLASATSSRAPLYHCVKPDVSKLQRSTEDALSKLAFEDDARIVGCVCEKRWCVGTERPGALITVIPLGGNK
jgi:Holliday junction resolvase RusA-like endonuclease